MGFKLYISVIFLVAASDAAADEYQWTFKNINFSRRLKQHVETLCCDS